MKSTITSIHPEQIVIRAAYPDDSRALRMLAALDSSQPVETPALVAEVGGEIRAAMSLSDGHVVADPFSPTEHLTVLLQVHASRLAKPHARRGRSAVAAAAAVWRALEPRERPISPTPPAQPMPATPRDAVLASSPQAWLRAS
jgi:hypothetical protein